MYTKIRTFSQRILGLQSKRYHVFLMAGLVLAIILFGIGRLLGQSDPKVQEKALMLHDVAKDIDDPAAWFFKNEKRINAQGSVQQQIKTKLEKLEAVSGNKESETRLKNQLAEQSKKLEALSARLKQLSEISTQTRTQPSAFGVPEQKKDPVHQSQSSVSVEKLNPYDLYPSKKYFGGRENDTLFGTSAGAKQKTDQNQMGNNDLLDLQFAVVAEKKERSKNINAYLPANTLVSAVLLSGVDASAGLESQSMPQPVVLRITDLANFPNEMRGKLKSCRVGAQAWGEISSERVYIRPDTLSCVKKDGTVLETNVKGFVAGSDGKTGVRGRVVMRDGPMLTRSFFGGLLSGLGKGTSAALSKTSISPLGATRATEGGDIFKSAAAEGAGNAFDMMARHHIKRANQYHPVIQIGAGQAVDIVFSAGAWLGEYARPKTPSDKMGAAQNVIQNTVEELLGGENT